MFGKIVLFGTLLAVSFAELPVSGPYAPSGWTPQGAPFRLPIKFFAPQAQRETGVQIEITKQRVDFAGQLREKNAGQVAANSAYLPPSFNIPEEVDEPSGVDILRIQALPSRPTAQFKIVRVPQLNTREYFPQRQLAQVRRRQKFSGNIRKQPFSRQTVQSVKAPATQYGAPVVQPASQYGAPVVQPASQYGSPVVQPATLYGAPVGYPDSVDKATDSSFIFPTEDSEDIDDSSVTKGEYFVLTPDKTLQKVTYRTSQTEEEARKNGFSAQLKYTPVDQIDGPLYKYNDQGQLEKINRK